MNQADEILKQCTLLIYEGKYADALIILQSARNNILNKNAVSSFLIAVCHYLNKAFEEAVEACDKAIEDSADKKYPLASYNKGIVLYALGRHEEAIEAYDKAIEDSPDKKYPDASNNKGIALNALGRYEEAVEAYDKAIEDSPDKKYPDASLNKGNALYALGLNEEAVEAYDKAIEDSADKKYPLASLNKGNVLNALGRHEEAVEAYDKAIEDSADKKYSSASLNKGIVLNALGRHDEAVEACDKAIEDSIDKIYSLAWMLKAEIYFFLKKNSLSRHAAYISINQDNKNRKAIEFLTKNFSGQYQYQQRLQFLDILLVKEINELKINSFSNVRQLLKNISDENETVLYCNLLIHKKDILNTYCNYYSRLRISYLIFAAIKKFEWVYYIIDRLLDDGDYQLTDFDYFFYITSAANIAASKGELEQIIKESGLSKISLLQIDEYLYAIEQLFVVNNLIDYLSNDLEKEIYLDFYLKNVPYKVNLSRNELELTFIGQSFFIISEDYVDKNNSSFKNFVDSLDKNEIDINQVGDNICGFLKTDFRSALGVILKLLTEAEIKGKVSNHDCILLKAFAILRYEIYYQITVNKIDPTASFIIRHIFSTVVGLVGGMLLPATFFYSFVFNCLIDVCGQVFSKGNRFTLEFTWKNFLEQSNDKKDFKNRF